MERRSAQEDEAISSASRTAGGQLVAGDADTWTNVSAVCFREEADSAAKANGADSDSGSEGEGGGQEDGEGSMAPGGEGRVDTAAKGKRGARERIDNERVSEDEEKRMAKAREQQQKQMRAIVENSQKSLDEKCREIDGLYLQQGADARRLTMELAAMRERHEQTLRERESFYSEMTRGAAVCKKLESLCRELQRQNKLILEESKKSATEEQEKRQELSNKFHTTIKDISSKLEEQGAERLRQMKENETLREKLKHLTQQYDIREQHFAHQLRTRILEKQLVEARLKQQQELAGQEEGKSRLYAEQIAQLLKTEAELRAQLALYGDKFEQFQETLTRSNEVFARFKQEMEKMSRTIKKLERENGALRTRCEQSDVSLIELVEERNAQKKQLETLQTKKERLESLCRSLQSERKQNLARKEQSSGSAPPSEGEAGT